MAKWHYYFYRNNWTISIWSNNQSILLNLFSDTELKNDCFDFLEFYVILYNCDICSISECLMSIYLFTKWIFFISIAYLCESSEIVSTKSKSTISEYFKSGLNILQSKIFNSFLGRKVISLRKFMISVRQYLKILRHKACKKNFTFNFQTMPSLQQKSCTGQFYDWKSWTRNKTHNFINWRCKMYTVEAIKYLSH